VGRAAAAARKAPLEEGVSSEPVSAPPFPANRVNYRELHRLAPDQAFDLPEKASFINALKKHFPGQANREGSAPYQGIEIEVRSRIRELPIYARGCRWIDALLWITADPPDPFTNRSTVV
jgi:hypothetical protein